MRSLIKQWLLEHVNIVLMRHTLSDPNSEKSSSISTLIFIILQIKKLMRTLIPQPILDDGNLLWLIVSCSALGSRWGPRRASTQPGKGKLLPPQPPQEAMDKSELLI